MSRLILSLTAAFLCSCASAPPLVTPPVSGPALMSPHEAVLKAATAAPQGVGGVFGLRVQGTGRQDGNIYLNSEADYRDQRNLTIAVLPPAMTGLRERFGADADVALRGRDITVAGVARRVRIDFLANGQPTGKYYYQTHVAVRDPRQIQLRP